MGNTAVVNSYSNDQAQSQVGKIVIVTGGSTGIGYSLCKTLAQKGAKVIVASRRLDQVNEAVESIRAATGNKEVYGELLNLSAFSSIDAFTASITAKYDRIDVLINNGAVFVPPHSRTEQGFEVILGTNLLGNAYLISKLLPLIQKAKSPRIVLVGSGAVNVVSAASFNKVAMSNDIGGEQMTAADTSLGLTMTEKLLQTMYAAELSRRLQENPQYAHIFVASADPGPTATTSGFSQVNPDILALRIMKFVFRFIARPIEVGALSTLFLATASWEKVLRYRGGVANPGPDIQLLKITNKVFTVGNCQKVYDDTDQTIQSKGFGSIRF